MVDQSRDFRGGSIRLVLTNDDGIDAPGLGALRRAAEAMGTVEVVAPSGPYFFKLTGPSATVRSAREAFLKLLDSVKPT